MFRDMRVAEPPHHRCEAGDALETVKRRGAGDPCLPITKADLFEQVQARKGFTAVEYCLNERLFFGLWPAAGYTGSTSSLVLATIVASGCKSCIQAGQDVSLANNTACIAVATAKEIGNQSTAPRITSNAVFGVR